MTSLLTALAQHTDGRWHPGIGDPTFLGWFTVAAYACAAYLSYRARVTALSSAQALGVSEPDEARAQRAMAQLWLLLFVGMVLLGINKQLDLQSWFTETLRDVARAQGWYGQRRIWQARFVGGLVGVCFVATAVGAYMMRGVLMRVRHAALGMGVLASFVVIRAGYFYHLRLLGRGARFHWVLELSGIALIAWSAYVASGAERPLTASRRPLTR
jgi:hypothetical protein